MRIAFNKWGEVGMGVTRPVAIPTAVDELCGHYLTSNMIIAMGSGIVIINLLYKFF